MISAFLFSVKIFCLGNVGLVAALFILCSKTWVYLIYKKIKNVSICQSLNYLNSIETGRYSNMVNYNCSFPGSVHMLKRISESGQAATPLEGNLQQSLLFFEKKFVIYVDILGIYLFTVSVCPHCAFFILNPFEAYFSEHTR
jgi:hypothetical protein